MAHLEVFDWDHDDPLGIVDRESPKSNEALRMYASLGVGRPSIENFYKSYRAQKLEQAGNDARIIVVATMRGWCMEFRWIARLKRFDEMEVERQLISMRERADADRATRIKLLEAFRAQIVKALQTLDPASAQWADVTRAMQVVVQELRKEYGDSEALLQARAALSSALGDKSPSGESLNQGIENMTTEDLENAIRNIDAATARIEE